MSPSPCRRLLTIVLCRDNDFQPPFYARNKTPLFFLSPLSWGDFWPPWVNRPPPWVGISGEYAYGTVVSDLMSDLMPLSLVDLEVLSMSRIAQFFLQGVWLNAFEDFEDILAIVWSLALFQKDAHRLFGDLYFHCFIDIWPVLAYCFQPLGLFLWL